MASMHYKLAGKIDGSCGQPRRSAASMRASRRRRRDRLTGLRAEAASHPA